MPAIYQFDEQWIFTGNAKEISDSDGAPIGWTRLPPPEIPAGQFAQFSGKHGWTVLESRPEMPAPVVPVPESVGPFEARAALHAAGLLDAVEALIAHPDTDPLTRMAWERASEFRRDSLMIATMTAVLGWTEQQVDELFIAAAQVQA